MIDYHRLQRKKDLYCARRSGHEIEIIKPAQVIPENCEFFGFCRKCRNLGWWSFPKKDFLRLYKKIKSGKI